MSNLKKLPMISNHRAVWLIILILLLTSCHAGTKEYAKVSAPSKPENISGELSLREYYPPHARPKRLFHGVDSFQMNELDIVLVLLEIRPYAVISNYELSYLTARGINLSNDDTRMAALRSHVLTEEAAIASANLFKTLKRTGLIEYAIDYLYSTSNDGVTLPGGEGYPPLPANSKLRNTIRPLPPIYEEDPNNLTYSGKYPHYYRINVYTSEHLEIAKLFGKIVLEIKDIRKRGLSLPRYAQYKHGTAALFDRKAVAYNGVTNTEEYVFPGYIASNEVVAAHVQEPFSKRTYGNKIKRSYLKQIINGQPMVTLKTSDGQFLMQFIADGTIIRYQIFSHPDKNKTQNINVNFITGLVNKYNILHGQKS